MKREKQNLNKSPADNNASKGKGSILFLFSFVKNIFIYFFEGIKAILLSPYYLIRFLFKRKHSKVKEDETISFEKEKDLIKIIERKNQQELQEKKELDRKLEKERQKKQILEKREHDKLLKQKIREEQERKYKEEQELRNREKQRRINEKLEQKALKKEKEEIERRLKQEKKQIDQRLNQEEKNHRGPNASFSIKQMIEKMLFLNKKPKQKHNQIDVSLEREKTEKEILKEQRKLKKEQERFVRNQKKQQIKEEKRLRQEQKIKERQQLKEQRLLKIKEQKELEKKKEQERLIAKLEKKRKKEKLIIDKIEKDAKLKKEREESLKSRKENAFKLRQAKLEEKEKSKEKISFKEKIKKWYNNLSIIKDKENKAELARQVLLIDFESDDAIRSEQKIYYKYVAKKIETGVVETGHFPAFSKLDVHSFLLSEGYEVYEITPQMNYGKGIFSRFNKTKIKITDLVFFLTQLSTFLKSGLPLLDSIKILEKQTDSRKTKLKNLYKSIAYELTMGENFSDSLEKQGDSFPKLLINMIKSSEMAGNLPEVLDDMAVYFDELYKTKKQMQSAMTYPLVIFSFSTIVIIFILIFVIPEFVGIYREMEAELPTITKVIINISNFLQKNVIYLIFGILLLIFGFKYLYKTVKVFRIFVQYTMMHIWVFGKIIIYNEVTIFTKTFGSLLNHNVFITDSMEVLSKITENEIYKMLIFDTITNLAKGSPISNAFKNQWAFPIIAYEMLLTGEKTGELGEMMLKVSSFYQLQHKNAVNQIKVFIEPIMIVVLTVLVGIILMSVILPMFNMYSEIL